MWGYTERDNTKMDKNIYEKTLFLLNSKLCTIYYNELYLFSLMYNTYKNVKKSHMKSTIKKYIELWIKNVIKEYVETLDDVKKDNSDFEINFEDIKILGTFVSSDNDENDIDEIDYYINIDESNNNITYNGKTINYERLDVEKILIENNIWTGILYDEDDDKFEKVLINKYNYEYPFEEEEEYYNEEDEEYEEYKKEIEEEKEEKYKEHCENMVLYNKYTEKSFIENKIKDCKIKIDLLENIIEYYEKNKNDKNKNDKKNMKNYELKKGTLCCKLYKYTSDNYNKVFYNLILSDFNEEEKRKNSSYTYFSYYLKLESFDKKNCISLDISKRYLYVDDGHDFYENDCDETKYNFEDVYDNIRENHKKEYKDAYKECCIDVFSQIFSKNLYD